MPHIAVVFLMSSQVGGAGLNITGASRLILFDPDWNPANDSQSLSRVWRGSQARPVITYRSVALLVLRRLGTDTNVLVHKPHYAWSLS
jgi:hypothetical protein